MPQRHPSRPLPWRVDVGRTLGAVVVTVEGELTLETSSALADNLSDLIDGQGNLFVVVDLRSATVADARGLDVLVAARRSLEDRGGRFLLSAPRPEALPALSAAGLFDVIEVHPQRRHHPTVAEGPRQPSGLDFLGNLRDIAGRRSN